MTSKSVVFVAFEQHENLGVRYMSAVLSEAGYDVRIIDFRNDKKDILEKLVVCNPLLVGFSIIFEDCIYKFSELIGYLRNAGIQCHFTTGGHFPSLMPAGLFKIIPTIDSIVRFEGEHTLLDLVNHLHTSADWKSIAGISYLNNGLLTNNQLRSLEPDLDVFPYPLRTEIKEYVLGEKYTTILAGRGCIYNCSFCNTRAFYMLPPGPIKRIRSPVRVVDEMKYLHHNKNCSVFLFEDDDFPVNAPAKSDWLKEFCRALRDKGLSGKMMWKINCRPDEVDAESFTLMRQNGLFSVFLGLEDGTDSGLHKMNKRLKVSDHLRAVQILKNLGIGLDFGFMLFQPTTTYESLRENLKFLDLICKDGYMPVSFLKMLPYMQTKIKDELIREGRLKGKPGFQNYDFLENSLNEYYCFISNQFSTWLNSPEGLLNLSKWARIYLSVYSFFNVTHKGVERLSMTLKNLVSESNKFLIFSLYELSIKFESGNYNSKNDSTLENYSRIIKEKHDNSLKSVSEIIGKTKLYYLTKQIFNQ